jgi:hypothetical protein
LPLIQKIGKKLISIGNHVSIDTSMKRRESHDKLFFFRGSEYVDVYSNSWGPTDDGNRLEGPGPLAAAAVERAIASGRGGKVC